MKFGLKYYFFFPLHSSAVMLVAVLWRKSSGDLSSFSSYFLCALCVVSVPGGLGVGSLQELGPPTKTKK